MKSYIAALDNLPDIVKIIIAIPCLDILWNIYRLFKSIEKNDLIGIVIAAILTLGGWWVVPIVDIICLVLYKKIWWID